MPAGIKLVWPTCAAGYQESCDTFLVFFWYGLIGAYSLSSQVWIVLLPVSAHTCSKAAFLLCQHSCLSMKPAQEPNQLKNNCAFVVHLSQLFLRQSCFLHCLPSRNTKYFFFWHRRQESQGWKTRMVWEALLLKHSLGRVKQLFDGLCSCGYPVSSTQVWSFRAPSVDCSTMPGTHWGNVSLLWPPVWVLRNFFYGLHLMDFQLPWSRGWVEKVISHSK